MYNTFKKLLLIGICGVIVLACTWRLVNASFWDSAVDPRVSAFPLAPSK